MLGPAYIHHRKDFDAFYNFASSLLRLRKDLVHLISYGTDGEETLINALLATFPPICNWSSVFPPFDAKSENENEDVCT